MTNRAEERVFERDLLDTDDGWLVGQFEQSPYQDLVRSHNVYTYQIIDPEF